MFSILCPTRGRPDSMSRLVESALQTAANPSAIEFIFYIDDDDTASQEMAASLDIVKAVVGPRIVLSQMWNECWAVAQHDIFMQCGDDIIFRSNSWDYKVWKAFDQSADKIVLVHGRDGYQDAAIATHGFYHRKWTDAVGYFMPPYFSSDYNDLWWTEVADVLNRRVFLEDVYTEHMHPVIGKGPMDQTHQDRLVRHAQDNVQMIYAEKQRERLQDIAKLAAVIGNHGV